MKQPPKGMPITRKRPDLDKSDADLLKSLAKDGRCQQRLLTDGGHHIIYCGGYFHGPTTKTKKGLRCEHHKDL